MATVLDALRFQRVAFELPSLASPLYAALLDVAIEDVSDGDGPCARVLAAPPADLDLIGDAVVLRWLGAVHRIVLRGDAPALAAWFPTAGGARSPSDPKLAGTFHNVVDGFAGELVDGLSEAVQTNEVARSATLAVGFTWLLRAWRLPLRLLEVGASAGLNLRWDRWRYAAGPTSWGPEDATLRFASNYREPWVDVSAPLGPEAAVLGRRGVDREPIDPTSADGRLRLRSFVWPDQAERHARLDAALAAAVDVPAAVDRADAAAWVAEQLAAPIDGAASVVYHSIVWQYLPTATRDALAAAIEAAGESAPAEAPVAWLRMEPGVEVSEIAELRLSAWRAGEAPVRDVLLAHTGYHGWPVTSAFSQ